jgi:hypothetical protein
LEFIKQKNDSSLGIIPSEYAIKVTSNKQGGILKFQKGGQKVATKERPRIKPLPKLNSTNSGDFTEADK